MAPVARATALLALCAMRSALASQYSLVGVGFCRDADGNGAPALWKHSASESEVRSLCDQFEACVAIDFGNTWNNDGQEYGHVRFNSSADLNATAAPEGWAGWSEECQQDCKPTTAGDAHGGECWVKISAPSPAPAHTPAPTPGDGETVDWVVWILTAAAIVIGLCLFAFFFVSWKRRCPKGRKAGNVEVVWDPGAPYFYFLPAGFFLDSSSTSLPPMQHLREEAILVKRCVSLSEAFGNPNSMKNTLFVSHRWESPGYPDTLGHQFAAIRGHLIDNPHIEHVWYDWSCMPQNSTWGGAKISKSPEDEQEFKLMLGSIADLYLTSSVLILLDKTYMTRFWTLMEAWCSMITPTTSGVRAATRSERRFAVKTMHNAVRGDCEGLEELVFDKSPSVIHDILACPDVVVTNAKDKELMLPVVSTLDSHIREMMCACEAGVEV